MNGRLAVVSMLLVLVGCTSDCERQLNKPDPTPTPAGVEALKSIGPDDDKQAVAACISFEDLEKAIADRSTSIETIGDRVGQVATFADDARTALVRTIGESLRTSWAGRDRDAFTQAMADFRTACQKLFPYGKF